MMAFWKWLEFESKDWKAWVRVEVDFSKIVSVGMAFWFPLQLALAIRNGPSNKLLGL